MLRRHMHPGAQASGMKYEARPRFSLAFPRGLVYVALSGQFARLPRGE